MAGPIVVFTGDQYAIRVILWICEGQTRRKSSPTDFSDVEIILGNNSKLYSSGGVTYDSEKSEWLYHFTQEESFEFDLREKMSARVKIGDDVRGVNLGNVSISEINSRREL